MRSGWKLAVLAAAVVAAGLNQGALAQDDPRVSGVVHHDIPEVDISVLAGPGSGTTGATHVEAPDTSVYPIKLNRPLVAGQTYDVQATGIRTMTQTVSPPGSAPTESTKKLKVDLAGKIAVVAVDPRGFVTEFNLTVTKLTLDDKESLPAGKVINAKYGDKKYGYTVATGESLDPDAKDMLDSAFEIMPNDENPYLTQGMHKVGDTWPIDGEKLAKLLADQSMEIDPKNVKGMVTFKGLDTAGGVRVLRLSANWSVTGMKSTDPVITLDPAGSTASVSRDIWLPVDDNLPVLTVNDTDDANMAIAGATPQLMKMQRSMTVTIKPAK